MNYVFQNEMLKKQVKNWIDEKSIPHLLLWGGPGTGKTTLAKILINELDVEDNDVLYINASKDNGVELIRDRITRFSESMPWGEFKIVLLDEADYITAAGQAAMRMAMEQYHNVVRFILTANYGNRIIPAIKSRCQTFHITNQDKVDFTARLAEILIDQNVEFDIDTLDSYVRVIYPDLRKGINTLQQNVVDSKLESNISNTETTDWKLNMVDLFQNGNIRKARELICESATPEDYDDIYTFLYRNLDFFGDSPEEQDEAVIIIRNGMVKHTMCADVEINLAATLAELSRINS